MCKASHEAKNTRDAQRGDQTQLGFSPHYLPQFQRPQDIGNPAAIITCPKIGQIMTLSGIPNAIQSSMGIPSTITAVFVEEEDDVSDSVYYEGRRLDLSAIASEAQDAGITVQVKMLGILPAAGREKLIDQINGRASTPAQRAARRAMQTGTNVAA